MVKPGLAAVEIGRALGASAREVNRLLQDQGFQEKVNGAWTLTAKGAEHAVQVLKTSSNLPQAKSWDATYWRDGILDVLDTSAEALAHARAGLQVDRAAQSAQLQVDRAKADAAFLASRAARQLQDAVPTSGRLNTVAVVGLGLVGVAVATAVGFVVVPSAKRAWNARRDPQQPTTTPEPPSERAVDGSDEE